MGNIFTYYEVKSVFTFPPAVLAVKAGVDILLGPKSLIEAFEAVVSAVESGDITEERINESVRRILKLKKKIGRFKY